MTNCAFSEDISKKKCKSCNINHIHGLKCLIFLCFWVELCKTLERDGQEIKVSTCMKIFHFYLVKYAVFIKNENGFFLEILILATDGLMTIFNKCSKFWSDLINILGDYDILKSYPSGNKIFLYSFFTT